jgi:uncharacterized protein YecE (DUF72 family)
LPQPERPAGRLYSGTSGFAYPDWAPAFYPAGTRPDRFLTLYARRFPACELNNTFYQRPTPARVAAWLAATPADFRFAVKGQRGATMRALMVDAPGSVAWLVDAIRPFGERLGSVLYRIPADVPRNDARLAELLSAWPRDVPLTMEFQDPSWVVDEVLEPLRAHGVVLCATDLDESPEPPTLRLTGPFLYLRLRRTTYTEDDLRTWAARIAPFLAGGRDVYAFFKHDETGDATRLATRLDELTTGILVRDRR